MSLISEQLPNLMNGVSQQAVTMRTRSQGEEQINGLSSVVLGNSKRPPVEHITRIDPNMLSGTKVHLINRDVNERYIAVLGDGTLRVFDLDGNERTVHTPDGTSYLNTTNPQENLRAITIADYTFIVNSDVVVGKSAEKEPDQPAWGQVFVKSISYGIQATVEIDGAFRAEAVTGTNNQYSGTNRQLSRQRFASLLGSYLQDDPEADDFNPVEMSFVPIRYLQDDMSGGDTSYGYDSATHDVSLVTLDQSTWDVSITEGIVHVERVDGADFDMSVADSEGNTMVVMVSDEMARFTDLPLVGKNGAVTKIIGDVAEDAQDYYLKFQTDDKSASFGSGYWVETVKPGIDLALDASTMPHTLIRNADGTFTFKQADWGKRKAGDLDTSPWPSFYGRTINDIFFDQQRLCFLADDNVIMSKQGQFFDFFPSTVQTVLDDGPIDVATSSQRVSILKNAVGFNNRTLLFSDQTQFVIDADFLQATEPPSITKLTEYENQAVARPVSSGKTVFFAADRGAWTAILEMYVAGDTGDLLEAQEITEHVPSYIPSGVYSLSASEAANMLMVLSSNAPNEMFVYKYHWNGAQKLQSSWSKWTLEPEAEIYSAEFIKDECFLVVGYPEGTFLMRMEVSETEYNGTEDFNFRLDRRITEADVTSFSYDVTNDETTFRIPYRVHSSSLTVATRNGDGSGDRPAGVSLDVRNTANAGTHETDVTVKGDIRNEQFFVGVNYSHIYEFSEQVVKTQSGNGMATVAAGRLQLLRFHVFYNTTGYFRAEVKGKDREVQTYDYLYKYTGTVLGAENNVLGASNIDSGVFRFRVGSKSGNVTIRLINETFLPSTFTGAEWEGRYVRRSSRI